MSSKNCF